MVSRVIDLFRKQTRISFDRFMDLALYGPHGYFQKDTLRSAQSGDFLTSPEVSPLFGETLAELVRREAAGGGIGCPVVVDVGAGSGSLLSSLLSTIAADEVEPWAVEVSPPARRALAQVVGCGRTVSSLDELPDRLEGVIIANELLDNLPMALAKKTGKEWRELWVGRENGRLEWVEAPVRAEVEEWLQRFAGPVPDGGTVEVQIRACQWVREALERLKTGVLVVIDYGDTAEGLENRRAEGTLRTYRDHHLGPDPLAEPGQTDITADVNFTAVMETAKEAGASVSLLRQDELLEDLGLGKRIEELRAEELRHARSGEELKRLEARSKRIGAETLLHPRGLGGFGVLIARRGL